MAVVTPASSSKRVSSKESWPSALDCDVCQTANSERLRES